MWQRTQTLDQRQTVHARHVLIGQHEVHGFGLGLVETIHAVDGLDDLITRAFQGEADHLTNGGRVINAEHGLCHVGIPSRLEQFDTAAGEAFLLDGVIFDNMMD